MGTRTSSGAFVAAGALRGRHVDDVPRSPGDDGDRRMAMFPAARAAEVLQAFGELSASADHDLTLVAAMITAPPAPFVPADLQGRRRSRSPPATPATRRPASARCGRSRHSGPAPTCSGRCPTTSSRRCSTRRRRPASGSTGSPDTSAPSSPRSSRPAGVVGPQARPFGAGAPAPDGRRVARIGRAATAFAHRDAAFTLNIIGTWDRADEDEAGIAWARGAFGAVAP